MLGEKATTEIHQVEDTKGLKKLREDAQAGGAIAGKAGKALEKRLKRSIVSNSNYLKKSESIKRMK